MAKIVLEFDSDKDETNLAIMAINAQHWFDVCKDLDDELRGVTKYGASILNPSKEADTNEVLVCQRVRDILQDTLTHYGLSIRQ